MAVNSLHPSYSIGHSVESHVKALSLYNFIKGFEWGYKPPPPGGEFVGLYPGGI